jgi:NAD(P)-dependent dehydrogenase (short-subunit alcohol dehydrogenase family)
MSMQRFKGKVAVITGGSSGIGAELARQLAAEGAQVVACARRTDRLAELQQEVIASGGKLLGLPCDVTREGDLESVAETVREQFGRIDIVVANAGFGVGGTIGTLTLEDFRRQHETNLFAVVRTLQATLQDLKETRGCFTVMGSAAGFLAFPGAAPYCMSKAGAHAFAQSMRAELAKDGVSVVLLAPGYVDSEIRYVDRNGKYRAEWRDPVPRWLRQRTPAAVRSMLKAIHRRKRIQIITLHARLIGWMARFFPGLSAFLLRRSVRDKEES